MRDQRIRQLYFFGGALLILMMIGVLLVPTESPRNYVIPVGGVVVGILSMRKAFRPR